MRKLVLSLSLLFATSFAFAQMGINATGAAPANSAMLDVSSNSKGFLPPRMTTAQRGAIVAPAKGLVVYDTDENELYLYKGTGDNWYKLSSINPPLSLTSPTLTPIIGISTNPNAGNVGVQGETTVNNGGGTGVYGVSRYTTPAGHNYGVYGENLSTNNFGYGIYGKHAGTGIAIYGDAPNGIAIKGVSTTGSAIEATSSIGIAVYGASNGTIASGLFQNSGGGIGVWGQSTNAGIGGAMQATGTGNGLNTSAISGKAIDANNNSATNATGQFTNIGTGFGVQALTNSGSALYGFSGTGNGLYAEVNGGTAAAARIVNNNGTGNAIHANNNSATNATIQLTNAGGGASLITQLGNVGIGTNTPIAPFTVAANKTVLFGADTLGAGTKMMWVASKGAFRGGKLFDALLTSDLENEYWNPNNIGIQSFAFGYNVKASGDNSLATGFASIASGLYSTAMGSSEASGHTSTAMGTSRARGYSSTAMGNSTASGATSFASGHSTASGVASTALGGSTASGNYSTASGYFTKAKSYASISMGRYNDTIMASNPTVWISTDPLVTVGNGTDPSALSNALTIYKNGNHKIQGFTQLGDDAPSIKTKKLTGVTTSNDNTFLFLATGIANPNRILGIQVMVESNGYYFLPHSTEKGYIYTVNTDPFGGPLAVGQSIAIGVKDFQNSGSVMGMAVKVLITYEE